MISEIKISQYFHNRLQRDYGLSLKMFSDNIFIFFFFKFISSSHFPHVFSSVPISFNYVRCICNFMGIGEKNDMNALIFVCKTSSFLSKSNNAVMVMQDTSRTFRTYVRLFTSNLVGFACP